MQINSVSNSQNFGIKNVSGLVSQLVYKKSPITPALAADIEKHLSCVGSDATELLKLKMKHPTEDASIIEMKIKTGNHTAEDLFELNNKDFAENADPKIALARILSLKQKIADFITNTELNFIKSRLCGTASNTVLKGGMDLAHETGRLQYEYPSYYERIAKMSENLINMDA